MIIHLQQIDSTNDYLKRNYTKLPNNTLVYANYQTSGKGRIGRNWKSNNKENITASILIKDEKIFNDPSLISLYAAKVIHQELIKYNSELLIKWPNDILYNNDKICGILCEAISKDNKIECIVVGFGINTNQKEFDKDLLANSLSNITNKTINNELLINNLYNSFCNLNYNLDECIAYLNNYLAYKNELVSFYKNNETKQGIILSINKDGSLAVEYDGKEENVLSGEIKIIR